MLFFLKFITPYELCKNCQIQTVILHHSPKSLNSFLPGLQLSQSFGAFVWQWRLKSESDAFHFQLLIKRTIKVYIHYPGIQQLKGNS